MLATHLHLSHPSGLFPSGFRTNNLYAFFFYPVRVQNRLELFHFWKKRGTVTSWMVTGWTPDEVTGIFNWPNPSSRTVVQGPTQSLREMSSSNLDCRRIRLTTSPPSVSWLSINVGASTSHNPVGLHGFLTEELYIFTFTFLKGKNDRLMRSVCLYVPLFIYWHTLPFVTTGHAVA
jgi:hypothetical protein